MKKTASKPFLVIRWSPNAPAAKPRVAKVASIQAHPGLCTRAWQWIQSKRATGSGAKRLHLAETVSLGEKRFVAVVQVDGVRLLIGGSSNSVSLLTQLQPVETFQNVLTKATSLRESAPRRVGGYF